jgi:CBS domain-containing protein/mannitol/fructose-specific phosphotransferase system IIA component (Ntr-type)
MELLELLPPDHIVTPLAADTLGGAMKELVERLIASGALLSGADIEQGLNERRDVVAAGPDVVLPHYRTDAVERLVVCLGLKPDGLDATDRGLDTRPRLVALIVAPRHATTLYLQTVSMLARLFRDTAVIDRLVQARSPEEVRQLADLEGLRLQPRLTVRDIMVHQVQSVTAATPAREAVQLMVRRRLRALPVVGDKQEVLGVVTEWDVMRALLPQIPRAGVDSNEPVIPDTLRVKDIMTRSVLCISEDLGLEEAANMMINKDVEQFPVTSEGKLSGFVTRGDIIRKLLGR